MKKFAIWIFLILIFSACSILPVDIIINDGTPTVVVWTATAVEPIETLCPGCEATATVAQGTPQETITVGPATETPEPTSEPTEDPEYTATAQIVTLMPTGTATVTALPPTATSVPVVEKYAVQQGSPVYIPNFVHTASGCAWMGIGGQVFNKAGSPMPDLLVVAEGSIGNNPLDQISLTSLASAYGPGGYELLLADRTIESSNVIFISIYDLSGNLLSQPLAIETFDDCEKNLIVVNFKEK
ncbi:MAG: hypothetical protein JEZ00_01595 [Anaerolineaceae bacterium]|nr:hypothetical protein [Anaerolineaceae bacterium]